MIGEFFKKEQVRNNPRLAKRLARELFNPKTKEKYDKENLLFIDQHLMFGFREAKHLSKEVVEKLQERFERIGVHLIEAARRAPVANCNGDYYCARDFLELGTHEVIHAAVAWYRRKDTVPLFLQTESQVNEKDLIVEELYAALGLEKTIDSLVGISDPRLGKIEAKNTYFHLHAILLRMVIANEYRKENPEAAKEEIAQILKEFDELYWDEVIPNLEPELVELMDSIYDALHENPPRYDVLVQWFLKVTEDYPEYKY